VSSTSEAAGTCPLHPPLGRDSNLYNALIPRSIFKLWKIDLSSHVNALAALLAIVKTALYAACRFLYVFGRPGFGAASSISPIISSIVHTRSVMPAAIAGVVRNVL
jgi:hypothetical protein